MITNERKSVNDYTYPSSLFFESPYKYYDDLRQNNPVFYSKELKAWLVTSYDLVKSSLINPTFAASRNDTYFGMLPGEAKKELRPLNEFFHQWMLFSDPPYHDKVKNLVRASFTPRFVTSMQDSIRFQSNAQVEKMLQKDVVDIVPDITTPLSVGIIAEVLGVSKNDYLQIVSWTNNIIGFMGTGTPEVERGRQAMSSYKELQKYLYDLFDKKRINPTEDLVSNLVQNQQDNDVGDQELLATVANILIDGHEPSSLSLANGINALIDNPEQYALLQRSPELANSAVEEVLRYDPAFSYAGRRTTEANILGGVPIGAEQRILFLFGGANRDPSQFSNPHDFNITRSPNKHLTFGHGTHYCLGSALARATISEALMAFSQRINNPKKLAQPNWRHSIGYRAFDNLPISFDSRG
ncbi:MAG: cytochrome P450 [bacterium]|nr:cytochrome P450 [bacterium]